MCFRIALFFLALAAWSRAEPRVLLTKPVHLGVAGSPEWEEFAHKVPPAPRLELEFEAEPHAMETTLSVRQRDVKQEWLVAVNNRRIGKLFLMESNLVQTIPVPPGTLRAGSNTLSISRAAPGLADDIVIDEIALDARAPSDLRNLPVVQVEVKDHEERGLPCRITIADARGSLAAISPAGEKEEGSPWPQVVRPGVIYTVDGRARVALPPGAYTVVASRGFEYGTASEAVTLTAGTVRDVSLRLNREVATPGLVACDTHIHTVTFSRHGDATIDERMATLAGEGIELPIATDHDVHVDYREAMRRTGTERWFTPVIGNEVTTRVGHFNIFPIDPGAPVVDAKLAQWEPLLAAMRSTPGVRVVILNHPRSIHSGFRPFAPENFNAATGDNRKGLVWTFDAVEVLNSGAQQTDYLRVYHDWFALLNHGHRIVTVGASDSHDVSRFIVGQARTYLTAEESDPAHIDVAKACENLLAGRAFVSMGLLAIMTIDGRFRVGDLATGLGAEMHVEVEVRAPSWIDGPTTVALYANGARIRETELATRPSTGPAGGSQNRVVWRIPRPRHDMHFVAIATAPAVTKPFWEMTRPYQPNSPHWQGRAIGSTNPIWLDADGDAKFSSARAYAQRIVGQHAKTIPALLAALAEYDEAVAAQAASVCQGQGIDLTAPAFLAELPSAVDHVHRGFVKFREADIR